MGRIKTGSPTIGSAADGATVTPSDSTDLTIPSRAVYVGVSGDMTVDFVGGTTNVLIKAAPVGYHPIRVKRIRATGTTATNILALY